MNFTAPEVTLCQCGCGQPAPLATMTSRKAGRVAGKPCRFIRGHNARVRDHVAAKGPRILIDDETGCWNWQWCNSSGYGRIYADGKVQQTHRYYFEQHVRSLLPGEHVHHRCNNKSCCNPEHLEALNGRDHSKKHGIWKAEVIGIVIEAGVYDLDELRAKLGVV